MLETDWRSPRPAAGSSCSATRAAGSRLRCPGRTADRRQPRDRRLQHQPACGPTAPRRASAGLRRVLDLIAEGRLDIAITEVGSLADVPAVHQLLAEGRGDGKRGGAGLTVGCGGEWRAAAGLRRGVRPRSTGRVRAAPEGQLSAEQIVAHLVANDELMIQATEALLAGSPFAYYDLDDIHRPQLDALVAEQGGLRGLAALLHGTSERLCALVDRLGLAAETPVETRLREGFDLDVDELAALVPHPGPARPGPPTQAPGHPAARPARQRPTSPDDRRRSCTVPWHRTRSERRVTGPSRRPKAAHDRRKRA